MLRRFYAPSPPTHFLHVIRRRDYRLRSDSHKMASKPFDVLLLSAVAAGKVTKCISAKPNQEIVTAKAPESLEEPKEARFVPQASTFSSESPVPRPCEDTLPHRASYSNLSASSYTENVCTPVKIAKGKGPSGGRKKCSDEHLPLHLGHLLGAENEEMRSRPSIPEDVLSDLVSTWAPCSTFVAVWGYIGDDRYLYKHHGRITQHRPSTRRTHFVYEEMPEKRGFHIPTPLHPVTGLPFIEFKLLEGISVIPKHRNPQGISSRVNIKPILRGTRNRYVLRDLRQRKYNNVGELAAAHDLDPRYLQRWLADRPYLWEGLLPSDFLKIPSPGCFDWTQIRQIVDGDTKMSKLRPLVESISPERQHAASCTLIFRRRQDLLLYLGISLLTFQTFQTFQRFPSLGIMSNQRISPFFLRKVKREILRYDRERDALKKKEQRRHSRREAATELRQLKKGWKSPERVPTKVLLSWCKGNSLDVLSSHPPGSRSFSRETTLPSQETHNEESPLVLDMFE